MSAADATESAACDLWLARKFRETEPKDVHGRRSLDGFETGEMAEKREAAVGADRQCGAEFVQAVRREVAHAANDAVFFHEMVHAGVHHELELRILRGFGGNEFEEAHLRNHQDVGKTSLEAAEIKGAEGAVRKLKCGARNLRVWNPVQLFGEADLVEDFHDRGVNGVAAEFAVEILVLLEESDGNAAASEEKSKDGTARTGADDAAGSFSVCADFFGSGFGFNGGGEAHGSSASCEIRGESIAEWR